MAIDYLSIGARIKYYRTQKGLSQEELADTAHISRSYYGYIERGEKHASLESIIKISNALNIPADELLVDNLTVSSSKKDGDDYYILLDCSPEEASLPLERNDFPLVINRFTSSRTSPSWLCSSVNSPNCDSKVSHSAVNFSLIFKKSSLLKLPFANDSY